MEPEKNEEPRSILPLEAGIIILCSFFFTIIPEIFIISLSPEAIETGELGSFLSKLILVVGEAGLIIFPIIYLRSRDFSPFKAFRLSPIPGHIAGVSIAIGFGLTILVDELDRLIQLAFPAAIEWTKGLEPMMRAESGLELLLLILGAVVLAAVVEEALFRGLLQEAIEKHIDVTKAVVYSSLIWAAFHFNPYFALQTFLFGFFLGYLTWRSGSIYPAVICHAINNSVAVLFYNSDFDALFPYYQWENHVSPLFILLAIFAVYRGIVYIDAYYRRWKEGNVE